MVNSRKICIIIPFYGPWPHWIEYFMQSCKYNPSITWLIFSDNPIPPSSPGNIHFITISLPELAALIKKELGITPQIMHPYKLVDFKPAFGLIFRHEVMNYDFWGYSDLDLVYGNISHFITHDIIEKNDVISPGMKFIPGHFALFRNIDKINTLFMKCLNWRTVFTDSKCYCFDEKYVRRGFEINDSSVRNFIAQKVSGHLIKSKYYDNQPWQFVIRFTGIFYKYLIKKKSPFKDFNQAIQHYHKTRNIRLFCDQLYSDDIMKLRANNKSFVINWNQGSLYDSNKEILYFHFQLSKYDDSFSIRRTGKDDFKLIKL